MTDYPEKMKVESMDVAADRIAALREIVPEAFSETGIDWDTLRRALGDWVDPGKERFGLNWAGKAECMRVIQQPSIGTLLPKRDESVDFDNTENVIIEGDNLEVLKLLQKSYYGQVKMIYIDPPYNTGNEFIYPDNFKEGLQDYLRYSGQTDDEGLKLSANVESDGRYHSKWLNMMYPRLFLARNLLREDGLIFISIDEHEFAHLRLVCNEILGEENLVAELVWEKNRKNDARLFSVGHEYMLVFARSLDFLRASGAIWREPKPGASDIMRKYRELRAEFKDDDAVQRELRSWYAGLDDDQPAKKLARYKWVDKFGPWRDDNISWPGGGGPRYDVIHPATGKPCAVPERGWVFANIETMNERIRTGAVVFREDHTKPPYRKKHLLPIPEETNNDSQGESSAQDEGNDELAGMQVMPSVIYRQAQVAVKYLRALLGEKVFTNPKDHEVLQRLIRYCSPDHEKAIFLDFFAGSGSFGEAVMSANESDGGNRRFVLVQLPEAIEHSSYRSIADLLRERIRRAGSRIAARVSDPENLDVGFRSYKLAQSNFLAWGGNNDNSEMLQQQLIAMADNTLTGRSEEDVLTELLLRSGFPLSAAVDRLDLTGKTVFSVSGGALLMSLDEHVTIEVIESMVARDPQMIICLDEGFRGDDQLKVNAVQTVEARNRSAETDIVFRVV